MESSARTLLLAVVGLGLALQAQAKTPTTKGADGVFRGAAAAFSGLPNDGIAQGSSVIVGVDLATLVHVTALQLLMTDGSMRPHRLDGCAKEFQ
jgi:hypothetical protein